MKLWRKLLAAVTAGTICLGSIGAMLSVSAETELDSSAVSENSTEVKASKGAHTHYYGEFANHPDSCDGWRTFVIINVGNSEYAQMGDSEACQYAIDHGFAPNENDESSGVIWLGTNPTTTATTKVTTKTTTKTTTTTTQPSVPTAKEGSLDKGDIDGSGSLDSTDVSTPCCTSPMLRWGIPSKSARNRSLPQTWTKTIGWIPPMSTTLCTTSHFTVLA